eukprot:6211366-Pleurochrysis_carterae.AAC.2
MQRRHVAVHREDAVRSDEPRARARARPQRALQLRHVTVRPDPVDDGCMVVGIGENGVLRPQDYLKQAGVGVEARRVEDGVLRVRKGGDGRLELLVDVLRAADEAD